MSTNGTLARNGVGFLNDEESGSLSPTEKLKQKLQSSSGNHSLFEVKKKRTYSQRELESIKLIGQHLRDLGLVSTVETLTEEAECPMDHPLAAKFRQLVISGKWDEAHQTLDQMELLMKSPEDKKVMHQLLAEERYLELLEGNHHVEALWCLRREVAFYFDSSKDERFRKLSSLMMYKDPVELQREADWSGASGGSRHRLMDKLLAYLPASIMLPPHRLQTIIDQALLYQTEKCLYHCQGDDLNTYSLLHNHMCSKDQIPSETLHVLSDHKDEVWYVKFSNDGKRLASGSKGGEIIIWDVEELPKKLHVIKVPVHGVACLSWSPNDALLLACGQEDEKYVYLFDTETGALKCRINKSSEDSLTSCAWQRNGNRFFCAGLKGHFYDCSTDGTVLETWEGVRVQAVAAHPKTNEAIAVDTHHRVRSYNFSEPKFTPLFQEDHPVMSMCLSKLGNYLLLNLSDQSIHLWNIEDCSFVQRFQGLTQGFYTVHSCFGGHNESFIASGSEDNMVYIWNLKETSPIAKLEGHSRIVNCVSWNPVKHDLLASSSDDGTVRIWATKEVCLTHKAKPAAARAVSMATSSQHSLLLEDKSLGGGSQSDEKTHSDGDHVVTSDEEEEDDDDSYNESEQEEESESGDDSDSHHSAV